MAEKIRTLMLSKILLVLNEKKRVYVIKGWGPGIFPAYFEVYPCSCRFHADFSVVAFYIVISYWLKILQNLFPQLL